MTRRIVTLTALLGIAGTIVLGATDVLDRDTGPSGLPSLPSLSAEAVASSGADDGDLGGRTVSVDSDEVAMTRLDPELLAALRSAADQAAHDGVEVLVTSGWRSKEYQQRLLDRAITKYGGVEEALRWVASPETSSHLTGDAVDVGPTDAAYWMQEHGPEFGLCQTYANEIWHYELRTSPGGSCPPPLTDGNS